MGTQGRPCRLFGEPGHQLVGEAFEWHAPHWIGQCPRRPRAGRRGSADGHAEPDGSILPFPQHVLADCGVSSRARICSSSSVAVEG